MSGHSKWAQIKHKKAAQDKKRGKLFSKIIREITIAAKIGGGDPEGNPRLRTVIEKAKSANMPNDNIERAIKKGTGEIPGVVYEEVSYEAYGPGGVALYILATTDNKNRTTGEIRHVLSRFNGNLGSSGSVAWQFESKGIIHVSTESVDEDTLMAIVLEAGAEDLKKVGDSFEIITGPRELHQVVDEINKKNVKIEDYELTMLAQSPKHVTGKDAEKLLKLIEALEELDDIQNVYSNFDISEEELEAISQKLAS